MPEPRDTKDQSAACDDPGAWERFESAVDAVMKAGPQHRPAKAEKAKTTDEGQK